MVRMIVSATMPNTGPANGEEITDHTKKLQVKVQQSRNEIQGSKWSILPLESLQDACVESFIHDYLSEFPHLDILIGERKQLIEIISTHPVATNLLFLAFML